MSQNWTDNCFDTSHTGQVDLQAIEDNFACLNTFFFGTDAPSNPVAGKPWFDATKLLPKIRNAGNSAWLGIMTADAGHMIWVYRNAAPDGWVVFSAIYDIVLAVKGGSYAYNVSGGNCGGTWAQYDHTHAISHNHGGATGSAGSHDHDINVTQSYGYGIAGAESSYADWKTDTEAAHAHAIATESGSSGGSSNLQSAWRPLAAVGTLQYMNI